MLICIWVSEMLTNDYMNKISDIVVSVCQTQARLHRASAAEAIGPVFEKILRNLQRLQLTKPLQHYVRRTAMLEARRFYRSNKWSCQIADSHRDSRNGARDIAEDFIREEEASTIQCMVNGLPHRYRTALIVALEIQQLGIGEEHLPSTVNELARAWGVSKQTIYNYRDRAIHLLRQRLSARRFLHDN